MRNNVKQYILVIIVFTKKNNNNNKGSQLHTLKYSKRPKSDEQKSFLMESTGT